MPAKTAVYSVETKVDAAKAAAEARKLAAIFRAELAKISVAVPGAKGASGAGSSSSAAATRAAAAAAAMATKAAAQAAAITTNASAQAAATATKAAAAAAAATTKAAATAAATTAKASAAAAAAAARAARTPSTGGLTSHVAGIGGTLRGGLAAGAAYVSVQAIRQAAEYAMAIGDARTANLRAASSFTILAGSAKNADAQIRAIREASGGTIDKLTAMQIATQATALKLASTAEEMGQLTRAARQITLVSATIGDAQTALTELSLFAANAKSFARADQLGLDVGSLKDRMKELQAADGSLDDSQAKLAASIQLLEERYGKLLDTEAAQASGAEQLRVAYADLKAEIASGTVGDVINEGLTQLAGALNEARVAIGGSTDPSAQKSALDQMIKNADWQNETFALGADIGNKKGFEEVAAIMAEVNSATRDNVIGIDDYRLAVANTVAEIVKWRTISDEQLASLQQINKATVNAADTGMIVDTSAADAAAAAQKAEEARLQTINDLVVGYEDAGAAVYAYAQQLAELPNITPDQLTQQVEQKIKFVDASEGLSKGAINNADALVERFGIAQAKTIIEQQLAEITAAITAWEAQGISGLDLDLNISNLQQQLAAQVDGILAEADRLKEAANLDGITSQLNQSLSNLNSGAFDGVEGISAVREELLALASDVMFASGATDEQAAQFAYLSAVAEAAASSTSYFGMTQAALGVEFLNTNDYAGALASEMANLDGAYATGAISADYHRAALIQLVSAIYAAASAAGAAAPQLASLIALKNALLASGPVNTPQGVQGGNAGRAIQQREAIKAGLARREQLRDQQAAAAKEAAKGFKSAAGSAAKDFNSAAKSTKQAFENAAKTLESALRKVPGLFGTSEVTQKQLDLANAGGDVNVADDYLRRLRDEVENGKDWADVSIEGARDALAKVGISVTGGSKEILARFEQAWSDSSLFASKENLALINQDAVRQQLEIQDKIKTGQQNILDLFGATVDGVMAGVKAGDATALGLVAGELEGSDDKAIQEMAKGLRENNLAMIEKALALAVAEPMDAGGGGGGGGASIAIPDAPIFDPAEFYDNAIDPFITAGAQLSDPAFFAGFDAFGQKVADWQASAGAAMPQMPTGMFGPANKASALPDMAAFGSMGPVAGPALTVDPTTATDYMTALAAELSKTQNTDLLASAGKGMGQVLGVSMAQADNSIQAAGYVLNLGAEFTKSANTDMLATVGRGMAQVLGVSMAQADNATQATGYVQALQTAFRDGSNLEIARQIGVGIQATIGGGIIDNSTGTNTAVASTYMASLAAGFGEQSIAQETIGYNLATFIGFGFGDAGTGTIAADYQTKLSTDFGALLPNFTAIGDIAGMFVDAGFNEHDRSMMATQYHADLSAQFGNLTGDFSAIGDNAATFVGWGWDDHDFGPQADSMIADLKAAFSNDSAVSGFRSLGAIAAEGAFLGFKETLTGQGWLAAIRDELLSDAMESLATSVEASLNATTEARAQ